MTESELQAGIIKAIKAKGYLCLKTSSNYKVKQVTKGIPDLFVSRKGWPAGFWLGLEVKLPGGKLKPEQEALLAEGRIKIVREVDDALDALSLAESWLEMVTRPRT